jgi:hypothetical protein
MKHFLVGLLALGLSATAWAQTWSEVGEAGNLPGTAQVPVGGGPLTTITGTLDPGGDADMYLINIPVPANFMAKTWPSTAIDTQLWLFDLAGNGIAFDDDDPGGAGLQSTLTGTFLPAGGNYYLAVSPYDYDALDGGGLEIWTDSPFNTERGPNGPGAPGPIGSWGGNVSTDGAYQIDLQGASFVPEPATLMLLAMGGLLATRRRR